MHHSCYTSTEAVMETHILRFDYVLVNSKQHSMVSQILMSLSLQCFYDLQKCDLQCVGGKSVHWEIGGPPVVAQWVCSRFSKRKRDFKSLTRPACLESVGDKSMSWSRHDQHNHPHQLPGAFASPNPLKLCMRLSLFFYYIPALFLLIL